MSEQASEQTSKPDLLRVSVDGGKYTVVQTSNHDLYSERYGERWRELNGDNLVYWLAVELDELRKAVTTPPPVKQPDRLTLAEAMAELDSLVPQADHCTIEMELLRYNSKWRIEWKAYTKQTGYSEEHQTLAAVLAELVAKLDSHHLTVEQAVEVAEGQVQAAVVGGLAGSEAGGAQ